MPLKPLAGAFTVWQAMARPVDGSWNHAVLVLPLLDAPMGW